MPVVHIAMSAVVKDGQVISAGGYDLQLVADALGGQVVKGVFITDSNNGIVPTERELVRRLNHVAAPQIRTKRSRGTPDTDLLDAGQVAKLRGCTTQTVRTAILKKKLKGDVIPPKNGKKRNHYAIRRSDALAWDYKG
jgi:hypothetical protein